MTVIRAIIALAPLLASTTAWGTDIATFSTRNHHPFLHIYGLPPVQDANLAAPAESRWGAAFSLSNNAENSENAAESIVLDGESYFADLSFRYGLTDWLELGIDLPLVGHSGGFLDDPIADWHDIWGLSNSKRNGPENELRYRYEFGGAVQQEISTSSFSVGDVQLSAAIPLFHSADDPRRVAMRFSVKLPTGDAGSLHGSGATDAALALYAQDSGLLFGRRLDYLGFAGVLALGDGDVLKDQQRSAVPFGGAAATWHSSERLGFTLQLQAQGDYLDSDLDELGGGTLQLAAGGVYRLKRRAVSLEFALVEDLVSDATPDFALHFAVRVSAARERVP